MSSIKCSHCGLVQFSTGVCKRCKKEIALAVHPASAPVPSSPRQRSFRLGSDKPVAAWIITLLLLIANASLAYVVSLKSAKEAGDVIGGTIGGIIAWPLILLIIYGLSKKFRERYSLHAVINYGLGLNTIIQAFMSAG